jgi:O-antigen/teichoic acid export membrane protein
MMVPIFLNQFVSSWATYLRCHKQEPFLIPSLVGAICTSLSTIFLGKFFGVIGMTLGYCLLSVILGFIWGYFIFTTKKREWHE